MEMAITLKGKMSTFGGPLDNGVKPDEGLALFNVDNWQTAKEYFLDKQPPGTTGLARRLNSDTYYIACRWDYDVTPPSYLRRIMVTVSNPANGKSAQAKPMDKGPAEWTGRVADLSPGLAAFLGLETDDLVEVTIPTSA
jgi:hypothetical protein